jgi:hypothetical protein
MFYAGIEPATSSATDEYSVHCAKSAVNFISLTARLVHKFKVA